ncbi:MAG: hypothetical protein IJ192_09285 [Clostridia bacterium]|nr:hypothetical protein [Clostridia bacterium]
MENKQQVKIPKFIWGLAVILVISIIFLIAVQMPFSQKIDTYNKDHASAEAQISQYKDYIERTAEVKSKISKLQKDVSETNAKLTVNASKTADDIRDMLKNIDYDFTTLSVQEGQPDEEGRMSETGDPLYATSITFSFTATEQKLIDTLRYFESESDGSYFITNMNIQEPVDFADTGEESSKASAPTSAQLYVTTLEIKLYYFDLTQNQSADTDAATSLDESAETSA